MHWLWQRYLWFPCLVPIVAAIIGPNTLSALALALALSDGGITLTNFFCSHSLCLHPPWPNHLLAASVSSPPSGAALTLQWTIHVALLVMAALVSMEAVNLAADAKLLSLPPLPKRTQAVVIHSWSSCSHSIHIHSICNDFNVVGSEEVAINAA